MSNKHLDVERPEMETTVVESYLIKEVESLLYNNEDLQEWNEKIKKLG